MAEHARDEDKDVKTSAPVKAPEKSDKQKKREERDAKVAAEQSDQDAADVEAFLAARRGEQILRGADGSLDHVAYQAALREERLAAVRAEAGDDEDDQALAVREHEADERARANATQLRSLDAGTKDATRRTT